MFPDYSNACEIPGCTNPVYKDGVCVDHYDSLYSKTCSRCGKRVILLCYGGICEECDEKEKRTDLESSGYCPACGGVGWLNRIDSPMVLCTRCGGTGKLR
jgi:hypothetical protein